MTDPNELVAIAVQIDMDGSEHFRVAERMGPEPTDEEIAEAQAEYERRWGVAWEQR